MLSEVKHQLISISFPLRQIRIVIQVKNSWSQQQATGKVKIGSFNFSLLVIFQFQGYEMVELSVEKTHRYV